jgi:hypothetical protein
MALGSWVLGSAQPRVEAGGRSQRAEYHRACSAPTRTSGICPPWGVTMAAGSVTGEDGEDFAEEVGPRPAAVTRWTDRAARAHWEPLSLFFNLPS